jgi:hypothetical protein
MSAIACYRLSTLRMARPSQTTVPRRIIITVALLAAFTAIVALVLVHRSQLRPEAVWVTRSRTYKQQVLGASAADGELKHVEWDGDGWGDAATGDWASYLVFDPSNSLAATTKSDQPRRVEGIPCTVIKVRRLENQWYSVVLDMNQFWDKMHPNC